GGRWGWPGPPKGGTPNAPASRGKIVEAPPTVGVPPLVGPNRLGPWCQGGAEREVVEAPLGRWRPAFRRTKPAGTVECRWGWPRPPKGRTPTAKPDGTVARRGQWPRPPKGRTPTVNCAAVSRLGLAGFGCFGKDLSPYACPCEPPSRALLAGVS